MALILVICSCPQIHHSRRARLNGKNNEMKRKLFSKFSKSVLHPWFRLRRGLTLGVRALVRDEAGCVLLVRHTYAPGWMFPGGGVEKGETAREAITREVREEAGIICTGRPQFFGFYSNDANFAGDHVALYIIDEWQREKVSKKAGLEIRAAEFFTPDNLPSSTSTGTKSRLREVADGAPLSEHW